MAYIVALSNPSAAGTLSTLTASTRRRRRTGISVVQKAPDTMTIAAAAA